MVWTDSKQRSKDQPRLPQVIPNPLHDLSLGDRPTPTAPCSETVVEQAEDPDAKPPEDPNAITAV